MIFREIKNKESYLKKNYPFEDVPDLNDIKECIHCGKKIRVGDYKVQIEKTGDKEVELIVCPNAPECQGSVVDWFDI